MNNQKTTNLDRQDGPESALLHGRLRDVDIELGTAQLKPYCDDCIPLTFNASLDDEMLKREGRYIEVEGYGIINEDDEWETVHVEHINRNTHGGFDLDAFLDNPNPKIFDPDNMTTIKMTDEEWELFESAFRGSKED